MDNSKHIYTYEVCPYCGEEVMLEAELKVQTCPVCGRRIVACSMCRACDSGGDYCSKCCLTYQAERENEELRDTLRAEDPEHQFTEVRCDYFDDIDGVWCVDAWGAYVDEGEVVAKINPDTLEVTYNDPDFAKDEMVKEVVADKLAELRTER